MLEYADTDLTLGPTVCAEEIECPFAGTYRYMAEPLKDGGTNPYILNSLSYENGT